MAAGQAMDQQGRAIAGVPLRRAIVVQHDPVAIGQRHDMLPRGVGRQRLRHQEGRQRLQVAPGQQTMGQEIGEWRHTQWLRPRLPARKARLALV